MASPQNQHCVSCIGTLPFRMLWYTNLSRYWSAVKLPVRRACGSMPSTNQRPRSALSDLALYLTREVCGCPAFHSTASRPLLLIINASAYRSLSAFKRPEITYILKILRQLQYVCCERRIVCAMEVKTWVQGQGQCQRQGKLSIIIDIISLQSYLLSYLLLLVFHHPLTLSLQA